MPHLQMAVVSGFFHHRPCLNMVTDIQIVFVQNVSDSDRADEEYTKPQEVVFFHNPHGLIEPPVQERMGKSQASGSDSRR